MNSAFSVIAASVLLGASLTAAGQVVSSDICVYGATSGGVAAAVTSARLGKSVTLISVNNNIGGMTSGGLGVTDRGNVASIGGFSAEFYSRVGKAYGSVNPVYFFEPHVAEAVLWEMIGETSVRVYTNERLASVRMDGLRTKSITTESGAVFKAREFIDTTYEGDLMAMAGVTFTFGRESSSVYQESLAGVRPPQTSYQYDPYVVAGDPSSGLLPLVQTNTVDQVGAGDQRLQAYNFRLCLTQNALNKLPILPPADYDEARYELLGRYVAARVAKNGSVSLSQLIDVQQLIPNNKTDINANGELSTDFVGYNYSYATNTYAGRERIRQAHEDYMRGFLHYLATSPNVPANVRTEMSTWGLAKDEFKDTGGWPHQLYVREARRMVSDYVMTQQDCSSDRVAVDPIGLGSYAMDSHGVQRLAISGKGQWEGGLFGAVPVPYGISYRSIVPRRGECENLFCTFALSASHVAFASCRMEPVFMITSQSAATAAAFAIDDAVAAQNVNYDKLAVQLRADKQQVAWTCDSPYYTNTITLDQGNTCYVTVKGSWTAGANAGGWNSSYLHDGATGKGTASVTYTPSLPTNGVYDVYLWWVASGNRATNTPVDIVHAAGTTRVYVNQVNNGSVWYKVLRTNFNAGRVSSVIVGNDGTGTGRYCIADAVQWRAADFAMPVPPVPDPSIEVIAGNGRAGQFNKAEGRFTIVRKDGSSSDPVTVRYGVSGTARAGVDYAELTGVITLPANVLSTNVYVKPLGQAMDADVKSVNISLEPSAGVNLTTLSNATVQIYDLPLNAWKRANFTSEELQLESVSGDAADPDDDGFPNLVEYAMGTPPKSRAGDLPRFRVEDDQFYLAFTRNASAPDVRLVMENSRDLSSWTSAEPVLQVVGEVDFGQWVGVTCRLSQSVTQTAASYLRFGAAR